jgi:tetratricopeptide (TPR) repeat protein
MPVLPSRRWSGGHRDDSNRPQGGGGRGGRGGGSAGGGRSGLNVSYQRQLPRFLQAYGAVMERPGNEEAPLVEDYSGAQRRLGEFGDADDVAAASRAGLGSRSAHCAQGLPQEAFAGVDAGALDAEQEASLRLDLANDEKAKGNRAFSEGRHEDAVRHFSACIAIDASNHVFWSNRSAAHAALCQWDAARRDALQTTVLAPEWAKGFARLGSASMGGEQFTDAKEAYARACKLEPDNEQYKQSMHAAEAAEAKALETRSFKFHKTDNGSRQTGPKRADVNVAAVRNRGLLSFDADEGEIEAE